MGVAGRLQRRWRADGFKFCFIGGLAVQRWSEPRNTRDVDATLFVGFGNERTVIESLLETLHGRIEKPLQFALQNRVLLVEDSQGYPIDLSLCAMPFEEAMVERATDELVDPSQNPIRLCSPSDLVILKTFAGRPQDWIDVRGTIVRSGDLLEWSLIDRELRVLLELKDELDSLDRLLQLRYSL